LKLQSATLVAPAVAQLLNTNHRRTFAYAGVYLFFRAGRLRGTFAPLLRASDRPMAMACLRLLTFRPDRPLRSVPAFLSCIARFTF
jgi:hypothetical protein